MAHINLEKDFVPLSELHIRNILQAFLMKEIES